ncbi:kmo [Scenedesmus sp. PABB004]|nr:kmo [Scenedesmus sp. PABB004]
MLASPSCQGVAGGRRQQAAAPRGAAAPLLLPAPAGARRGPRGCWQQRPWSSSPRSAPGPLPPRAGASAPPAADAAPAPPAAVVPLYTGKRAVVVGAGPAGSTAAMFLARQGMTVDVFERRPEPRDDEVDTGRAYIIIVIPRGQAALNDLGVPLPSAAEYKTKGTVRHNKKGQVGVSREEGNVTFRRSSLAQYLIDQARAAFPTAIRFHFGAALEGVDIAGRTAAFTGPGGRVAARYDLLVGADGVGSAVRAALQGHFPDMTVAVTDSGREYKTYRGLRGNIEPDVTAHSNPDGTYSGTMSLKTGGFEGLATAADYEGLLRAKFVGLPDAWVPAIAAQVVNETPSPAGKRIRCSRLDGPGVLLLGDAAHAVTPVFGQGANSALESCKVLGQVLAEAGGKLDEVPARFTAARLEDMHALNELDAKAYSFFRRRGLADPDFLQLLSHVLVGTILSKLVPFLYGRQPALLQLGSSVRYSTITAAVRRDSLAAAAAFAALGLWLGVKLAARLAAGGA